jgi:hypothetical protein
MEQRTCRKDSSLVSARASEASLLDMLMAIAKNAVTTNLEMTKSHTQEASQL